MLRPVATAFIVALVTQLVAGQGGGAGGLLQSSIDVFYVIGSLVNLSELSRAGYWLGASCGRFWWVLLVFALSLFACFLYFCCIAMSSPSRKLPKQGHGLPSKQMYASLHRAEVPEALPSGLWRGYYKQYGTFHTLADFELAVSIIGEVDGGGVDKVGCYTICGSWELGQLKFHKQYIADSVNTEGVVNGRENKGHCVLYEGSCAGENLACGIRGQWTIPGMYRSGIFHLWPAMPDWQRLCGISLPGAPQHMYNVTADNICVICVDSAVNVCLIPCGHVAVCHNCAMRVGSQGCPICRSQISDTASIAPPV